jgi:putative endopeptidase
MAPLLELPLTTIFLASGLFKPYLAIHVTHIFYKHGTPMKSLACSLVLITFLLASCSNPPKKEATRDILVADMDTTVSPRVDFFHYANGGWLKANPIPSNERAWGIANLVREETYARLKTVCEDAAGNGSAQKGSNTQKIGDFYAMALDSSGAEKQGLEPLRPELERIEQIATLQDLRAVIALYQTYGIDPLFSPFVAQDERNSSVYALHLWQGGLGLPNRDYYVNTDARTANVRKEYVKHVAAMLALLGADTATAARQSSAIMQIETRLAKASRKLEDLRDPYRNYNKMSIPALERLTPSLKWTEVMPAMAVTGIDSVIVGQPEFYKQVELLLHSLPLDQWKSYLRWHLVNDLAPTLSATFDKEHFRFYGTVLSGVKDQRPRWKRALDAEESALGDMLGQLYVARYVPPSMKQRYEKIVDNMFEAYGERIKKLDWMSQQTKEKALVKLHTVTKKVCYPDKWKDYSTLEIDRSSYTANQIRANQWLYSYQTGKLGKPVDRTEWEMTPQTYNAYYNPSNNEIVLPAAIFIIPGLPDSLADDAIIYGYAGASTIGHEVTHGFDDEGRQFDALGNLHNWWTKEDEKRFNEKAKLMIDQFSQYVVLDSIHVNGKATLGENIADLAGLVIGYDAFKRTRQGSSDTLVGGLTPDQRYFLGYALSWLHQQRDESLAMQVMTDVHSPAFLRINGPVSNMTQFYQAFGVKPGDPMYRADSVRVSIW